MIKSITISMKSLEKGDKIVIDGEVYDEELTEAEEATRPTNRTECLPIGVCPICGETQYGLGCGKCRVELNMHNRPCPWVRCKWNNWCEITQFGGLKIVNVKARPWTLPPRDSCLLDLLDKRCTMKLEEVAEVLCISRQRVQQIEEEGKKKFILAGGLEDHHDADLNLSSDDCKVSSEVDHDNENS